MAWDGSGLAHVVGYDGRFARAFVSAGGLVGPACAAATCFELARRPRLARFALAAFGLLVLACAAWIVRSLCGLVFAGTLAGICLVVARRAKEGGSVFALLFVAVQLALSVFSRGDYLFTPVAHMSGGDLPSDVANMSSALFLPYWFWGAACGLFSVAVLFLGVRRFFANSFERGRSLGDRKGWNGRRVLNERITPVGHPPTEARRRSPRADRRSASRRRVRRGPRRRRRSPTAPPPAPPPRTRVR